MAGMWVGIVAFLIGAIGVAWVDSIWLPLCSGLGLVLTLLDTVVASWHPAAGPAPSGRLLRMPKGVLRLPAHRGKVIFALACSATMELLGTSLWIDGVRGPLLYLALVFFGAATAYSSALVIAIPRIYVELNADGVVDRARLGHAGAVAWSEIAGSSVRDFGNGNTQVLLHLKDTRPPRHPWFGPKVTIYINTTLISRGGRALTAQLRARNVDAR
jgi:hypothetical protein